MKEYGEDLETTYNELQKKLITVTNKIRKRAKFLIKECPDFKFGSEKVKYITDDAIDDMNISAVIYLVKKIDKEYAEKTRQLDLFDNDKTKEND